MKFSRFWNSNIPKFQLNCVSNYICYFAANLRIKRLLYSGFQNNGIMFLCLSNSDGINHELYKMYDNTIILFPPKTDTLQTKKL